MRGGRFVGVVLVALALLGMGPAAWAYWTSAGDGTGSATTATLNPPTGVVATHTPGTQSVGVSWTAAAGLVPQGYYVTRIPDGGGAAEPACDTSAAVLIQSSCIDTPVPEGTYQYTVIAVYRSWTAASGPSNTVVISTDTAPPVVTVTTVNGGTRAFPYSSNAAVTTIGGACGNTPGDSPTVTPLINGAGTTPATAPCNAGTWTLTLTTPISAEVSIAVSATQSDAAGNTGTAPTRTVIIDTTRPTLTSIVRAGASPTVNTGPLAWTVTFSEPVTGVTTTNFALALSGIGGTAPTFSSVTPVGASPSATWTVSVGTTATTGTNAGSIGLNLAASGSVVDPAGNTLNAGTVAGPAYSYDTTAPTVVRVTSGLANGSYKAGQVVPVTVEFTEPVTVAGTPQLTLVTGAPLTTAVNYTSGSGSDTLTFTYTIAAGNSSSDLNYQAVTSLALGPGGGITDGATNPATLTLPALASANSLGGNKALIIDTAAPVVAVTQVGGTVRTFPYATTGDVTSIGGTCGIATGDLAPVTVLVNGVSVGTVNCTGGGAWTLAVSWTTDGARIVSATQADLAGNTGVAAERIVNVDKLAPTVTGVSSPLPNGSYRVGQLIPVTVTFSEPVIVTGTPRLTLRTRITGNPRTTNVNYSFGSGTNTLTFNYTVAANHSSADLDYNATNSLALNGGTIRDVVARNATRTLATPGAPGSLGASKNIVIDTTQPTVSGVSSPLANGRYRAGQVVPVTVTFSEAVTVTGTPQLTLATGSPATAVAYTSGSGTTTLTFTYTVAPGHTSADLDYTATTALGLAGGSIADAAGNAATLSLAAPGAAGSLGASKALVIDTTGPVVTGVSSSAGNGTYRFGQVIPVTVTFSEAVTVTGTPQLSLATGTPATTAVGYSSGTGTTTLTFTYTIALGNVSSDLDYAGTTALALAGGTIADLAANPATLTLAAPGAAGSLGAGKALVVDGTPPIVTVTRVNGTAQSFPFATSATVTSIGGTCGTAPGDVATVNPRINGAATTPIATTCSPAGTWTLTLGTALSTSGSRTLSATQADSAGNTSTAPDQVLIIDKTPPTVSSIVRAGPSQLVNAGPLAWTVTFSEPVSGVAASNFGFATSGLTGTPTVSGVTADDGAPSAVWTVSVGMGGVGGTNAGSIGLNLTGGAGVVDAVGNALSTTSFMGATYTYDTANPTVTGVSSTLADGAYTVGQVVPVTVTFSEPVTVTGTPQLTLATGSSATTDLDLISVSGGTTLTFEYTVEDGDTSPDLDYASTSALALNGGTITDAAGNAATLTLAAPGAAGSLGDAKALVIDTTPPEVTVTEIEPLNFLGFIRLLRVAGTAEVGAGPMTVYLCSAEPSCDANSATQTFTNVAVGANGTWLTGWSAQAQGTWYASATQADAAGNVGTSEVFGPVAN